MSRALLLVAACTLLTGSMPGAGAGSSHQEPGAAWQRDALRWAYEEWVAMSSSEQAAYVSGFLAGAALVEAERLLPSDSPSVAIATLRQERRLTFGLRPNVYQVRIAEHYFWENHRGDRIAAAVSAVNRALANP